ncbi:MAG: PEP-CTERM sorting domain-containing protein [Pirellulales bacterium]
MKVTKWWKKMAATILAAGAFGPGACYAISIPLGDPSFDVYTVPANPGYAYAAPPNGSYRPTSAWVDDLDSPSGYTQDDGVSNWIYNSTYSEVPGGTGHYRAAPRTGNQAMHGLGNYSAQEVAATFQSEKIYTFSIWAQGDADANATSSGVFLYIFRGDVPFTATSPLEQKLYTQGAGDFNNRAGSDPVASKANWKQISITHTVFPGSPEIGKTIGVGFFGRRDAAVDDATLDVVDAATKLMILEVNTTNGQARIRNQTGAAINIDYYNIKSAGSALNATAWNSLQEQNLAGFPAGNGSGNGWEQAGGSSATAIGESYLTGNSAVGANANIGLGGAFNVGGAQDLIFEYGAILSTGAHPTGDYNDNGVVDAADYALWRDKLGQNVTLPNDSTPGSVAQADYTVWRAHFGEISPVAPSTLTRGLVHYVTSFSGSGVGSGSAVPEPSIVILLGMGIVAAFAGGRNRNN